MSGHQPELEVFRTIRRQTSALVAGLDASIATNPRLDLRRPIYLRPLVGRENVPAMSTFLGNHELRHRAQLRDILATQSFLWRAGSEST